MGTSPYITETNNKMGEVSTYEIHGDINKHRRERKRKKDVEDRFAGGRQTCTQKAGGIQSISMRDPQYLLFCIFNNKKEDPPIQLLCTTLYTCAAHLCVCVCA